MPTVNIYDMADTWNDGGTTFTAIKMNVTNTASNAASLLMDLQVDSGSQFQVSKDASLFFGQLSSNPTIRNIAAGINAGFVSFANSAILAGTAQQAWCFISETFGISAMRAKPFTFAPDGANIDTYIYSDAANTVAFRNSTAAQVTRGYRTFTDTSNYERWALQSGAGYFELATETAGTGTDNIALRLTPAGTGSIEGPAGTTSSSGLGLAGYGFTADASSGLLRNTGGVGIMFGGYTVAAFRNTEARVASNIPFGFSANADPTQDVLDVVLNRDAANILAQRNSTNAQITRGYRTFTDTSNYERWALQSGSGYFEWAAETAGTGTDNIHLRLTPSGTASVQINGTGTNDSANAGDVGEILESEILVASAVALTTATPANVTSISLTAGDWDVWGNVWYTPAATTSITIHQGAISQVSATLPTAPNKGAHYKVVSAALVPNAIFGRSVGLMRISLASTTTVYLVTQATFTIDALSAYGYIGARRVR